MKVAFITNFCPHYRVRTFETLARAWDMDFYFFSRGREKYWLREHGIRTGDFRHEYLPGFSVAGTRITPSLVTKLARGRYDAIIKCINGRFALPATYAVAAGCGIPLVLWTEVWSRLATPFHVLTAPVTRRLYRSVDAIVVPGEHVRSWLAQQAVDPAKVFVAPHCVDNEFYARAVDPEVVEEYRERLGIPRGHHVVLSLGRLEPSKGLGYLVEALAAIRRPDVTLLLVGKGSEEAALRRLVSSLRLDDRVRFAGYVPPEETLPYYALADVAVIPSITTPVGKEPWGLTVNEAMNQRLPVIATEAVGAARGGLVEDGVTGLVVPERNSGALAVALDRILAADSVRTAMGEAGARRVREWNNDAMAQGFSRAMEYAIANRRAGHRRRPARGNAWTH